MNGPLAPVTYTTLNNPYLTVKHYAEIEFFQTARFTINAAMS